MSREQAFAEAFLRAHIGFMNERGIVCEREQTCPSLLYLLDVL